MILEGSRIKRICCKLFEKQASATYNLVELAEKLEIVQPVPSAVEGSEKVAMKLGGDWATIGRPDLIGAIYNVKSVRIFSNAVSNLRKEKRRRFSPATF